MVWLEGPCEPSRHLGPNIGESHSVVIPHLGLERLKEASSGRLAIPNCLTNQAAQVQTPADLPT